MSEFIEQMKRIRCFISILFVFLLDPFLAATMKFITFTFYIEGIFLVSYKCAIKYAKLTLQQRLYFYLNTISLSTGGHWFVWPNWQHRPGRLVLKKQVHFPQTDDNPRHLWLPVHCISDFHLLCSESFYKVKIARVMWPEGSPFSSLIQLKDFMVKTNKSQLLFHFNCIIFNLFQITPYNSIAFVLFLRLFLSVRLDFKELL